MNNNELNAFFGLNTEDLINRDNSTEYKFTDSFASPEEYEQYLEKCAEFNRQENYNAGMSAIAAQQIWVLIEKFLYFQNILLSLQYKK